VHGQGEEGAQHHEVVEELLLHHRPLLHGDGAEGGEGAQGDPRADGALGPVPDPGRDRHPRRPGDDGRAHRQPPVLQGHPRRHHRADARWDAAGVLQDEADHHLVERAEGARGHEGQHEQPHREEDRGAEHGPLGQGVSRSAMPVREDDHPDARQEPGEHGGVLEHDRHPGQRPARCGLEGSGASIRGPRQDPERGEHEEALPEVRMPHRVVVEEGVVDGDGQQRRRTEVPAAHEGPRAEGAGPVDASGAERRDQRRAGQHEGEVDEAYDVLPLTEQQDRGGVDVERPGRPRVDAVDVGQVALEDPAPDVPVDRDVVAEGIREGRQSVERGDGHAEPVEGAVAQPRCEHRRPRSHGPRAQQRRVKQPVSIAVSRDVAMARLSSSTSASIVGCRSSSRQSKRSSSPQPLQRE
jgi:hypothetical protein